MEAVAIICNKNDGKLTKRILISFSSNTQANRVDFNEKEAVAIIHEKLMTNRVHLFFVEIAGFDARSLDTPYLSYSILSLRQPKGCELPQLSNQAVLYRTPAMTGL